MLTDADDCFSYDLMIRCWNLDPDGRPKFDVILDNIETFLLEFSSNDDVTCPADQMTVNNSGVLFV